MRRRTDRTTGWGIWSGGHWMRTRFFYSHSLAVGPAIFYTRETARGMRILVLRSFPKAAVRRIVLTVRAA